jgi:hypothetical protein
MHATEMILAAGILIMGALWLAFIANAIAYTIRAVRVKGGAR